MSSQELVAHKLTKCFQGRLIVDQVILKLRLGEVVGLLGPNGAGKTTCFYLLVGLVFADSGSITLNGISIKHLPLYRRARLGIGYMPQEPSVFRGLSVEDNILAILECIGSSRRERQVTLELLLEEFSLTRVRKTPARALSGGERRRVEIARALAANPRFILLDEPLAGIDPVAVQDFQVLIGRICRRGIGILLTDHNVHATLSMVDRAYILNSGRLLMEGTPSEILKHSEVRRVYLGHDFAL